MELLQQPNVAGQQEYYKQLTAGRGLEVKDAGEYRGKGVFALQHFGEGDVLFTEPPLCAIQHSTNRQEAWVCSHCFRFIGSVEAQLARLLLALQGVGGSDGASSDGSEGSEGPRVDDEAVEALVSRQVRLPHTSAFPLPVAVRCRGGCSEEWYCSTGCEQAEWEQCHQLLCTGAAESGDSSGGGSSEPAASAGMGKQAAAEAVHDRETADRETERQQLAAAVMEFNDLADATNDVFRLAAKVVVMTILRAERLVDERAAVGSNGAGAGVSSRGGTSATPEQCWQALQQAWLPWAVGHKGLWWECVAAPEEAKADMRQLATDSLELMTSALPPQLAARYCPLLSLEVWASIIGMFEMNNLSIYVASPLQRWLELLEGLPELQHQAALEEAGPYLQGLPEEVPGCEGNAFYALHSCLNHSCEPSVHAFKREQDVDGAAVILALRQIHPGEEISISYIDEEAPLEERRQELADYGFACRCGKCTAEAGRGPWGG